MFGTNRGQYRIVFRIVTTIALAGDFFIALAELPLHLGIGALQFFRMLLGGKLPLQRVVLDRRWRRFRRRGRRGRRSRYRRNFDMCLAGLVWQIDLDRANRRNIFFDFRRFWRGLGRRRFDSGHQNTMLGSGICMRILS